MLSPQSCSCRFYWRPADIVKIQYHSHLGPSVCQAENQEVVEFVRHAEDILGAHQRVAGMNFIPGGYKMPTVVWEARAEAESQLLVSGEGEIDTEPPSPT